MTHPITYAVVDGDELDALLSNLAHTTPCPDCGGTAAIVAAEHDITAELLHRPDCASVLEIAVDDAIANILGEAR